MNTTNDLYYIEEIRRGNTASFSYLVDSYSNMVYSIALKLVKNEADAEDLSQEIFLSVFQSLASFKGNSKFSTWVYRIAYNMSISKLRKKREEVSTDNERFLENSAGIDNDSEVAYDEEESIRLMQLSIKQLPDDDQLIIMLHYYESQTVDEIALITGLSSSNVKVKLHRIRKKLKNEIEAQSVAY